MKFKKIIIIILLVLLSVAYIMFFSSEEEKISDVKVAKGYYDCVINEKIVPSDAICYSEYYYDLDASAEFEDSYISVNDENILEVKRYMEKFKDDFLYSEDKGKKDFLEKLNKGDLYLLHSGCSKELSENDFKLYYYDIESYTLYYMWRCQ